MKKTLIALGLSISLAAGGLSPAPALASDRDLVGPALAGIGLLAVFAAASASDRERGGDGRRIEMRNSPQAPAWGHYEQERRAPEVRRDHGGQHAMPGACDRAMRHNGWDRPGNRNGWMRDCQRGRGHGFR